MSFNIKVGGVWNPIASAHVKVGGIWNPVQSAWVKVSGVWQKVYTAGVVTLTGATISETTNGLATVWINTDGTTDKEEPGKSQINNSTDWIIPNSAANANYEVSWTVVGDAPSKTNMPSSGTWYDLSVDRYVGYDEAPGSGASGVFTISIRYNGGATLDSGAYDIEAFQVP